MAFVWTETIAHNGVITALAMNEIRTKTDWLKDNNSYCSTHYATRNTAHYDSYLATNYSTRYAGHLSAECSSQLTGYLNAHLSGVLSTHYTSRQATYNATYCSVHNAAWCVNDYTTLNSYFYGTNFAVKGASCTTVYSTHRATVYAPLTY